MSSIEILRKFRNYDKNGETIHFIYQKEGASSLKRIKKMMGLKSENKTTMEISLFLMNKVFEMLVPGNNDYEKYSSHCNAIDILSASVSEKIECNCIMYSIVFSEVLLAHGIKSKVVICRPYDFFSNTDCHCMVQAYINEYKKWIVFDPAYNAVYRCNGKFLSLPELRECIIEDRKIVIFGINNQENRSNSLIESVAQYLVAFFCLEYNGFNCHSNIYDNNIHILLPIEYKKLPKFITKYNHTNISFYDKGFWLM